MTDRETRDRILAIECAQRGASYLDAQMPYWYQRVDSKRIDIEHSKNCILGQLFGDYYALGAQRFRRKLEEIGHSSQYGFNWFICADSKTLNLAWKNEVNHRVAFKAAVEMVL